MNKTSIELDFLLDQIDYTSVADPDPGSGAFLPPGSGMEQWSDPDPG
jgi:hypothetical protein